MKSEVISELSEEISDGAHEVFKRLLGYYGREKRKSQGPSLLGMETDLHTRIPNAEDIDRAMQEVRDEMEKGRDW